VETSNTPAIMNTRYLTAGDGERCSITKILGDILAHITGYAEDLYIDYINLKLNKMLLLPHV
jgi:hypothetical protein